MQGVQHLAPRKCDIPPTATPLASPQTCFIIPANLLPHPRSLSQHHNAVHPLHIPLSAHLNCRPWPIPCVSAFSQVALLLCQLIFSPHAGNVGSVAPLTPDMFSTCFTYTHRQRLMATTPAALSNALLSLAAAPALPAADWPTAVRQLLSHASALSASPSSCSSSTNEPLRLQVGHAGR